MRVPNSDPWSIVSLAYLLRYPNPYASHILSCDVISREVTPQGSLLTTRLILKTGSLPRWAPKGMISRGESWVLEESEVDPLGKVMRCTTKNLDHVKVMRVEEHIHIRQAEDGYVIPSILRTHGVGRALTYFFTTAKHYRRRRRSSCLALAGV